MGQAPRPNQWARTNYRMSLRQSIITQVFSVPMEERRFKELAEQQFGEKGGQPAKICSDIMAKTGVAIEMSLAKDQSLTMVITGKEEAVMRARKMVVQQLQTQARHHMEIPKEHHRFLLGPKGKKLMDLELSTATKITVPRAEENSNTVIIVGSREGLEKARHEIQLISDEQAKLAFERLPILKIYHPFICGPDNQQVKALAQQTGARISVPPPSVLKDEICVAGEKEGVYQAKQTILQIYEEKKLICQTVSVEVRKSQHKYVIGPRGSNLSEILGDTGVSVEVPPLESTSETITLRGPQDKLGPALTQVYAKANSVVVLEVEAPAWLHRFIIGRKGANVSRITEDLPKVHIEFADGEDKVRVEGPPGEAQQAEKALIEITRDLVSRMAFAEIDVDQKYHRHIIGRSGANVTRIKKETGVSIKIPSDTEKSNIIRIEGSPEGVAKAKQELLEMVHKMENEKSRDILIEQRFHRQLIGAQGGKIREIRDKFNQVQITFPDAGRKVDVVTLRGPKTDVDKCFKYLQQVQQELIASNSQAEVHIFKQFHKNIIGKGGANIRKIREDTDTKIDLPSENSDSDVITITGKKENVLKAKERVEAIQKELANIKEVTIDIPHSYHNSIIGAKGRLIRAIMEECGGVLIRFPQEGSRSDKVIIRGPVDDVEKAKKQLTEHTNELKEASHTGEVRAKPEYHKFLIGRGGSNIQEVRKRTGARVIFPTSQDTERELITIIGRQEAVEAAKLDLLARIKDLDDIVESEMDVDPKHHRHFVARRGEVLRHLAEEYGGVTVSFPRSGVKSSKVVLKGAKDCVDAAKRRIQEIVVDLDSMVTMECHIPQKFHRTVMGSKGYKVQEITREHEVGIKFPDRPTENNNDNQEKEKEKKEEEPAVNGDGGGSETSGETEKLPKKQDIIVITGKKERCEAAKAALLALVPVTEEVTVPFELHRFIIGQKGKDVRKMMEDHDVNISIPPAVETSDVVKVTGPPANVAAARQALEEKITQLEGEQEDRKLRGFQLEVEVDSKHHPKIIGRRGAVISKIRDQHEVQIQFPERGSPNQDVIIITGYEANASAARDDILKIVTELEDMVTEEVRVDARIHSRLIGSRGRAIHKIMDDYKVDIKFPSKESGDPDIVFVSGSEENVLDCKDHLLNLQEEYMQDVTEKELMEQYRHPPSRGGDGGGPGHRDPRGFVVRNAPWSSPVPDTSSEADFPDFLAVTAKPVAQTAAPAAAQAPAPSKSAPIRWGPPVKR